MKAIEAFHLSDEKKSRKNEPAFKCNLQMPFAYPFPSKALKIHIRKIEQILKKIIPEECYAEKEKFLTWIQTSLPYVKWIEPALSPDCIFIYLLCQPTKVLNTEIFFIDLLRKWLIPEKEIRLLSSNHLHFHLEELPDEFFFVCEAQVLVEDGRDLNAIKNNLPQLAKDIISGIHSSGYAKYILETKPLSMDLKTSLTHQELVKVLQKRPNDFDNAIFTEMSRFLSLISKDFRDQRPHRHITRLICSHYLIRRSLNKAIALFPEERHLYFRFSQTRLQFPFGSKTVLGLMLGINLLDKYEFFEEKHVLLAVQKVIPDIQVVKGSVYLYQSPEEMIRTLYVELEKKDGSKFTLQQLRALKSSLQDELEERVEKLIPAVFMIRNEEEVLKNILILSQELKFLSDLPQIMISLEKQSAENLIFTIILVRVLTPHSKSLESCFLKHRQDVAFISERTQIVGYLRKKYPKEANVFRLEIPKETCFFRADSSVNFYLARQKILSILQQVIGEVRDFNGGMILKQGEQFSQFKHLFHNISHKSHDLLENFFYSLSPIEMQATLPLSSLEILFKMFLDGLQEDLPKKESFYQKINKDKNLIFAVVRARDSSFKDFVVRRLNEGGISLKSLAMTSVSAQGSYSLCFAYNCLEPKRQNQFLTALRQGIEEWRHKIESSQVLRLSFLYLPLSCDPRIGGDDNSEILLRMLYDGLMRIGQDEKPHYAVARHVHISENLKQYTFKLRECYWSNGSPVSAYDFEYAWKKILSPHFKTPFAYLFSPIKNAKNAKEGRATLEEVGIKALDERTLFVELEHPTPYFLELTAHTLYSPVNHVVEKMHPNWAQQEGEAYVCNGPFMLKKRNLSQGFELVKNRLYWNADAVQIDQILISKNNASAAVQMFKNREIDWLGRPFRPWDSVYSNGVDKIERLNSQRVYWYAFNVKRFPFHHPKLRRAFSYAIDRKKLAEYLSHGVLPAFSPLPLAHVLNPCPQLQETSVERARELFQEALQELGLKKKNFPIITLIHTIGEMRDKAANFLRHEWQNAFGIDCRIERYEWRVIFEKILQDDFQIGGMNWRSWINDPIYTLNAFRHASDKVNFAKWESEEFKKLLEAADHEVDRERRLKYLAEAEEILLREMPVIPIVHEIDYYIKNELIQNYHFYKTGSIDFKNAFLRKVAPAKKIF